DAGIACLSRGVGIHWLRATPAQVGMIGPFVSARGTPRRSHRGAPVAGTQILDSPLEFIRAKARAGTNGAQHERRSTPSDGPAQGSHALAKRPRLKKRSLSSSDAVSRLDLMPPILASAALTAGRSLMALNQRARFGLSSHFTPWASWLRVHGKVAMSAIE